MRRARLAFAMLAVFAGAGYAAPYAEGAAPPASQRGDLDLGAQGGEVTLRYPFTLEQDGSVYAKLSPTPWNPLLPSGNANGSVAADRSAWRSGWAAHLVLEPHGAAPMDLGWFADDGASRLVPLPGGWEHVLAVTIHAPPGAGQEGAQFRADVALAHRAGDAPMDTTWGLAARLTIASASPAPLALDLALPLLGAAGIVAGGAVVVAARRLRARRAQPWL